MGLNMKVLQCEKCGGEIVPLEQTGNAQKIVFAKCIFCGTPYALSEEHAPQTQADYIETNFDRKIRNGYEWMHVHNDYESAVNVFKQAIDEKVDDYRGFWGVVNALSKEFTYVEVNKNTYSQIASAYQKTLKAVQAHEDEAVANQMSSIWEDYVKRIKNYWHIKEIELSKLKIKLSDKTDQFYKANKYLNNVTKQISDDDSKLYKIKYSKSYNNTSKYIASFILFSLLIIIASILLDNALLILFEVLVPVFLVLIGNSIRLKVKYSRLAKDKSRKEDLKIDALDNHNNKYREKEQLEKTLKNLETDLNDMKSYL